MSNCNEFLSFLAVHKVNPNADSLKTPYLLYTTGTLKSVRLPMLFGSYFVLSRGIRVPHLWEMVKHNRQPHY